MDILPQELVTEEESKYHIPGDTVNFDDRVKVLNHYDTFAIMDRWGDVQPYGKKVQGVYHQGMRFLNRLQFLLNGIKPLLLSSNIKEDNDVLSVDLTNPNLDTCDAHENTLHISRSKFLRNGVYYEELSFSNYGQTPCKFYVELTFGADFKDIFEIRGIQRTAPLHKPELTLEDNKILFTYIGLDQLTRRTEVIFNAEDQAQIRGANARFDIELQAHEVRKIHYTILFNTNEQFLGSDHDTTTDFAGARKYLQEEIYKSRSLFPEIHTSNEQFNHWLNRSRADLLSLLTQTQFGKYPYAGVPWYNTAFGRDGIITAMEVLWLAPEIGRDVLNFLANLQAKKHIPAKDAEPGKIMHETRTGEMANIGEIPFKEYYGTIDATPLFIMLAGMYYERTGNLEFIESIWPNIKAAVQWIEESGDTDGDGYVEYKHKAENGLTNQGWKDSFDSIMYEDGRLCEPPIALAEVQGYVYGARRAAAKLANALADHAMADDQLEKAARLKQNFNRDFWDEALNCYVLALDGNKKPCRVVSSNPGHCLFTGIVDEDKAVALAKTLTGDDMFSGWGIRTLGKSAIRYNPMSYHNGSIWPHDNAVIAFGFARYGFQPQVLSVLKALFDASLFVDLQRLPELYCGFEKREGEGPTDYPVACSPQAWSVGAVFMLLQSCLNIRINALERTIVLDRPELPDFIDSMTISNLRIGGQILHIQLERHQYDVGLNVVAKPEGWKLIIAK